MAAQVFELDVYEMEERHHLTYDTYEAGKLTMEEYLKRVVFYQERPFSKDEFKEFIFKQSKPFPEMINLVRGLKEKYELKVAVVSNEGKELALYRIHKFKLNEFVDFFISSSFVHFRKPDSDIFKVALDIAQVSPGQVLYIEDRPLFLQVAENLGIHGLRHIDFCSTVKRLAFYGLII
jgi:putative hydrolase of the HAD superfamily